MADRSIPQMESFDTKFAPSELFLTVATQLFMQPQVSYPAPSFLSSPKFLIQLQVSYPAPSFLSSPKFLIQPRLGWLNLLAKVSFGKGRRPGVRSFCLPSVKHRISLRDFSSFPECQSIHQAVSLRLYVDQMSAFGYRYVIYQS